MEGVANAGLRRRIREAARDARRGGRDVGEAVRAIATTIPLTARGLAMLEAAAADYAAVSAHGGRREGAGRPAAGGQARTKQIQVLATEEEHARLVAGAERDGMSLGGWLRALGLERAAG